MKSDDDIRSNVEKELKWDPDIDATDIAVAVKDGVVTLTGFVRSYSQKIKAEADVKRVDGVRGVANDIEVRVPTGLQKTDPELARDVVAAIKDELPYSSDRIRVVVKDGWVTLEGEVEWQFQRERAEIAARRLKSVKGIINSITLKPTVAATDIKAKIEAALRRVAEVDAQRIQVETNGSEVVLKGTVRSWAEREEAERTAWQAPGVTRVENRITVLPL